MAEEKYDIEKQDADDVRVLRELLHAVRGLSPVSSSPQLAVNLTDDEA